MEKVLFALLVLVLCVTVRASDRHHPKFPQYPEHLKLKTVPCNRRDDDLRNQIMEQSQCGEPKEVFVSLTPRVAHEEIYPGSVWVKKCVGLCDFHAPGSKCVPRETMIRHIPIRITNVQTSRETCSTYTVEEHISCGCCNLSEGDCEAPRVFNPRKCTCQCPDHQARLQCKRTPSMKWNRYKCTCEPRRKTLPLRPSSDGIP